MTKTIPDSPAAASEGVAAVDRALAVAIVLAQAGEPLSLADLARRTDMYKSTLLRLLASLEKNGLVGHRPDKRYALGPLAFLFGVAFENTHGLKEALQPLLERLVKQGTESPSFHVRHGKDTRLCLFRIDSGHSTLDRVSVGDVLPLKKGAAGKVLIAFSKAAMAANANAGETQLVYTSFGERDPLCGAIACPVFGPVGTLLGALSLSGPLERFSDATVKKMSTALLAAGQDATQALGGQWPGKVARKTR